MHTAHSAVSTEVAQATALATHLATSLPPSFKNTYISQLGCFLSFTIFSRLHPPQTGRLGLRTGVVTNFDPYSLYGLPLNETTMAEYLNPLYRTAMTGTHKTLFRDPHQMCV
jgi:hypothetical protein